MLFILPVAALVGKAPHSLVASLHDQTILQAVSVSLRTSGLSLAITIALGTPLAALLGLSRFPGRNLLAILVEAPIVLPPAAAGIGLLLAFGRKGLIPTGLPFTMGAVVLAQVFVSAPLYVRPLAAALESLDSDWSDAAALDGASAWRSLWKITLPLIRPVIISSAVIAWARSLGEFGATILFAGNLVGKTQTIPLAIYLGLESDLDQAVSLSVIMLGIAFAAIVSIRILERFGSHSTGLET